MQRELVGLNKWDDDLSPPALSYASTPDADLTALAQLAASICRAPCASIVTTVNPAQWGAWGAPPRGHSPLEFPRPSAGPAIRRTV